MLKGLVIILDPDLEKTELIGEKYDVAIIRLYVRKIKIHPPIMMVRPIMLAHVLSHVERHAGNNYYFMVSTAAKRDMSCYKMIHLR